MKRKIVFERLSWLVLVLLVAGGCAMYERADGADSRRTVELAGIERMASEQQAIDSPVLYWSQVDAAYRMAITGAGGQVLLDCATQVSKHPAIDDDPRHALGLHGCEVRTGASLEDVVNAMVIPQSFHAPAQPKSVAPEVVEQ